MHGEQIFVRIVVGLLTCSPYLRQWWTLDSVMVETVLRRSTKLSINQCISFLESRRVLDAHYMCSGLHKKLPASQNHFNHCLHNKLSCRWQTARRICANAIWRGWRPKIRLTPYVLPCRIWSFCVRGRRHKYRSIQKIGERWIGGMVDPENTRPHIC